MLKINNSAESAELYITGDIVDDTDGAALAAWDMGDGFQWPADVRAQLDAMRGKPLTVYINSDGGSVPAGVAIANMISRHDAPTKAVVDGWCCSIATQIFFAADAREMPENAYLMIHKPWTVASGDADEMMRAAAYLETIQTGLETTYARAAREGVTPEQIHELVNAETWLTGKDAAELFEIDLREAAPTLNCIGGKAVARLTPPENVVVNKTEPQAEPQAEPNDAPAFDEVEITKTRAKVKAALAIMKGVITK